MNSLRVIDSHTAGEPTRVVLSGEIRLVGSTMQSRLADFRTNWDHLRTGILLEPRGSDILVGAILTPPAEEGSIVGVVFFNNAGILGMCGHGTIGVVETLKHLNLIGPGTHRIDTVVGTVSAFLNVDGDVSIQNVPAKRIQKNVVVELDPFGSIHGDIAYGGNFFFIVNDSPIPIEFKNEPSLNALCRAIKSELANQGISGPLNEEIDHIELTSAVKTEEADSVNYVLCPGNAFDRSPCGTGTSAKLACLYEDGKLQAGEWYVQQSITGSRFRGKVELDGEHLVPTIAGRAWIVAETKLIFSESDPLRWGLV